MSVIIRDESGKSIRAAVQFEHRGFIISLSAIPRVPEIRILGGQRHPGRDMTEAVTGSDLSALGSLDQLTKVKSQIDDFVEGRR